MNFEKIGISCSILGAIIMTIFGLTMAYYTKSEAILLDGTFNLLSVFLSIGSLIISFFIDKGYSKNHPMGFYAYEAFIILLKGVFILGLVVMALYSNITTLVNGGREPNLQGMLLYSLPGVVINILTLLACYFSYQKNKTGLLKAEYEAWKLNTLITSVIAFSLLVVLFLQNTSIGWIDRYIDQILVIILCFLTIMDPINLIKGSFSELMLKTEIKLSPDIIQFITEECDQKFILDNLFIIKLGRGTWIYIDLVLKDSDLSISNYLNFQNCITNKLKATHDNMEAVFTLIDRKNI